MLSQRRAQEPAAQALDAGSRCQARRTRPLYVWYAFRNATAHHGEFDPEDPSQRQQSWYRTAVKAQQAGAQPGGGGADPYFEYLQRVSKDVVRWELESDSS
jgi:hypothetical protein